LWSFILAADDYASKQEHRDAIAKWGTLAKKSAARTDFEAQPGSEEFLKQERERYPGEPPEPP
jgi:hypothetical protein